MAVLTGGQAQTGGGDSGGGLGNPVSIKQKII